MMDHGNPILSLLPKGVYRYTPSSSSINWPVEPVVWNCVLPALHLFFCCSHFIEKISEYKISNTTVIGQLDFTWFSSVQIKPSKPSGSLPLPIRTGCLFDFWWVQQCMELKWTEHVSLSVCRSVLFALYHTLGWIRNPNSSSPLGSVTLQSCSKRSNWTQQLWNWKCQKHHFNFEVAHVNKSISSNPSDHAFYQWYPPFSIRHYTKLLQVAGLTKVGSFRVCHWWSPALKTWPPSLVTGICQLIFENY